WSRGIEPTSRWFPVSSCKIGQPEPASQGGEEGDILISLRSLGKAKVPGTVSHYQLVTSRLTRVICTIRVPFDPCRCSSGRPDRRAVPASHRVGRRSAGLGSQNCVGCAPDLGWPEPWRRSELSGILSGKMRVTNTALGASQCPRSPFR